MGRVVVTAVAAPDVTRRALVVDLDGTLCRTDTLWETLFVAWRHAWWLPLVLPWWLVQGRSVLKARLAARALPDVATLPWNEAVVAALRTARAEGRPTVLATAADARVAEACAAALGLFDRVFASTATHNLKAGAKAAALVAAFGEQGFDYIGDSRADLAVWPHAAQRYSVGRCLPAGGERLPAAPREGGASAWLRLIRVRHWVKNVLVFVAPAAAHEWNSPTAWQAATLTFAAFCAVCSAIYIVNDLFDLGADRRHPSKRARPLAAGELPLARAAAFALVLLAVGAVLAWSAGVWVSLALGVYVLINAFYTGVLKRYPVYDVFCLAVLYTLRIAAGALAVGVALSAWLAAFSVFAFLSLALLKRAADLGRLGPDEVLPARGYRGRDSAFVQGFGLGSAIAASLVLALYAASDQVSTLYAQPLWLWGAVGVVLFWLARMWQRAMVGTMDDDPVLFATTDAVSWGCALAVAVCVALAV